MSKDFHVVFSTPMALANQLLGTFDRIYGTSFIIEDVSESEMDRIWSIIEKGLHVQNRSSDCDFVLAALILTLGFIKRVIEESEMKKEGN